MHGRFVYSPPWWSVGQFPHGQFTLGQFLPDNSPPVLSRTFPPGNFPQDIYMYWGTDIHTYIQCHTYIHTYTHTYTHTYIHIRFVHRLHIHTYTNYTDIHTCVFLYLYASIYVCMHA